MSRIEARRQLCTCARTCIQTRVPRVLGRGDMAGIAADVATAV
jgi:hypothetical protein